MPASAPPPRPAEESASLVVRFGAALGVAAAGAVVCSAPATVRVSAALAGVGGLNARVWLALSATALGPMAAAIVVLRGASEGLRGFAGPGAALRAFGIALWLVTLLAVLTWFGSLLRATTHHHALAGVTFACGALALGAALGLVCARIVVLVRGAPPAARGLAVGALGGVAFLALLWAAMRFTRSALNGTASSDAAATVVDVLAYAFTALLAARRTLALRALALVGPPVAVVIVAVGVTMLRDAGLRDAIAERAPAFAPAARLVSGL
jgi:hypothetical protein